MKQFHESSPQKEHKQTATPKQEERYLTFSRLGGAGTIKCLDCNYQEDIIAFLHGPTWCTIGRQCPQCHSFLTENNQSQEYHRFGDTNDDFVCPKCGTILRSKTDSILKRNWEPIVCPRCQSKRLTYILDYIT